jgi:hypothetical protein
MSQIYFDVFVSALCSRVNLFVSTSVPLVNWPAPTLRHVSGVYSLYDKFMIQLFLYMDIAHRP